MIFRSRTPKGVMSLVIVMVVLAVAILISSAAALHQLQQAKAGIHQMLSYQTFAAANGCMEHAARQLRLNVSYAGGNLTLGNVDCVIAVNGGGTSRVVTVTATKGTQYQRTLQATLDWSNGYKMTNWQELNT